MQNLEQKITLLDRRLESFLVDFKSTSPYSSPSPYSGDKSTALATPNSAVTKSDHIKLTFPTYGGVNDDPDPLSYLSKCHDFLALHPLSDADILATFRTVLRGTARDWWEIARSKVTTWSQFETIFLAAFLAEDYEDELAERVRTKKQKENETIRDFAFSYRALCKRWKPSLTEASIVKMILKNIKPFLASQLRGRVDTVEDLVRLGHQLEKDHEQQLEYNLRMYGKNPNPSPRTMHTGPPFEKNRPLVLCWRCKGNHLPGSCPHYSSPDSSKNSPRQIPKHLSPAQKTKDRSGTGSLSLIKSRKSGKQPPQQVEKILSGSSSEISCTHSDSFSSPLQLIVPISISTCRGKAIVDTGASYTLIHEYLWVELKGSRYPSALD